jgi:hypothetical protein
MPLGCGCVRRDSVAGDLREDRSATFERGIEILQREERRTFAEHEAGARLVEWAHLFHRGRLQRVEADEDHFRNRVVAAAEHAALQSRADEVKCVPDCIRAGRARVRDDLQRRAETGGLHRIHRRLLHRVICHERRATADARAIHVRAVKMLAERHPAARRADDHRIRHKRRIARKHLAHGVDHHVARAVEARFIFRRGPRQ